MKKRFTVLTTVVGFIILLGGLLMYGLGVHNLLPVPRPDLVVVGTSLIGILMIISGCAIYVLRKQKKWKLKKKMNVISLSQMQLWQWVSK